MISGRPIIPDVKSEACLSLARGWIRDCIRQHDACPHNRVAKLPTRVVDVGSFDSAREPLLLVTNDRRGQWVALSHCWGKPPVLKTIKSNYEALQQAIPVSAVPATFRDAIYLTRALGYRYIWIDSLCIIQDDEPDWVAEAGRMSYIYKNAVVTIAADSACNDEEGVFDNKLRKPEFAPIAVPICPPSRNVKGQMYFRERHDTQPQGALNLRAWALQENILSPRTLHYYYSRMFWECQQLLLFEEDVTPVEDDTVTFYNMKRYFLVPEAGLSSIRSKPVHERKFYELSYVWNRIVNNYVVREITFHKDRLPALGGLAMEFQQRSWSMKMGGYTYVAGLWLEDIHQGLLWSGNGLGITPPLYLAPSWSWASLRFDTGPTEIAPRQPYGDYIFWGGRDPLYDAKVVDCKVYCYHNAPFGQVQSGYLTIRGRWHLSEFEQDYPEPYLNRFDKPDTSIVSYFDRKAALPKQVVCDLDQKKEELAATNFLPPGTCYFQIAKWLLEHTDGDSIIYALILVPTGNLANEYRRIGRAEIPDGIAEEGWEIKTVTII